MESIRNLDNVSFFLYLALLVSDENAETFFINILSEDIKTKLSHTIMQSVTVAGSKYDLYIVVIIIQARQGRNIYVFDYSFCIIKENVKKYIMLPRLYGRSLIKY